MNSCRTCSKASTNSCRDRDLTLYLQAWSDIFFNPFCEGYDLSDDKVFDYNKVVSL